MKLPTAVALLSLALVLLAVLLIGMFRYQITAIDEDYYFRLDRLTGKVQRCTTSGRCGR